MKVFAKFSDKVSNLAGRPYTFVAAALLVLCWFPTYFLVGSLDTWQLIINTTTTIVTFLMVFIIQNTQNRTDKALHVKLDAILHIHGISDDELLDAESKGDKELEKYLNRKKRTFSKQKGK